MMSLEVHVIVKSMGLVADMSAQDHQYVDIRMADVSYLLEQTLCIAHVLLFFSVIL